MAMTTSSSMRVNPVCFVFIALTFDVLTERTVISDWRVTPVKDLSKKRGSCLIGDPHLTGALLYFMGQNLAVGFLYPNGFNRPNCV